ncbi:MAG: serine hydroxymethyltransferase [Deltaproteobacteria bacterium]|nr:serine hydroxymethyltransferase [Deltaproteobacteria bacterium]MCX7952047.1 serine hydroxymethyltransferase [Deltaproteobacteria bacterium]
MHDIFSSSLSRIAPELYALGIKERDRLLNGINLIASENLPSLAVIEALTSFFSVKYAEGYPGKRYYSGCEFVDIVEETARNLAKEIFGLDHANVQPHSGAQANHAVFEAILNDGDTILALSLDQGGHLTHGHKVNFSGKRYNVVFYSVDKETQLINFDEVEYLAEKHKPKLIIAGSSAYSRVLEFDKFGEIARKVSAYLLADIAHYAGLIAGGHYPSPDSADFVTTTTHKTLRGPRGGLILCKGEFKEKIDRAVFPFLQGGPHMHTIFAKAICFKICQTEEFKRYTKTVIENARKLCSGLIRQGFKVVTGGTDCHMFLLDLTDLNITGKEAQDILERVGVFVNKNTIPYDPRPPAICSGIRLGTPFITSLGVEPEQMDIVAEILGDAILRRKNEEIISTKVRDFSKEVYKMCGIFDLYNR